MAELSALELQKWVTTAIQDYDAQDPALYLADTLAPRVAVKGRFGVMVEAISGQRVLTNASRARGAEPGKGQSGYQKGATYQVEHLVWAEDVTKEDRESAQSEFGLDIFGAKGTFCKSMIDDWREALVCSRYISVDPNTYDYDATLGYYSNYSTQVVTLTGTDHWNDAASEPFVKILNARSWFATNTKVIPNTVIIPEKVGMYLREHPDYKAEFGTNQDLFAIGAVNPMIRDLKVIVARQKLNLPNGTTVNAFGNNVWIGRVEPFNMGGTYMGHALQAELIGGESGVRVDYNQKSRVHTVEVSDGEIDVVTPKLNGSVSGYLIRNVLEGSL